MKNSLLILAVLLTACNETGLQVNIGPGPLVTSSSEFNYEDCMKKARESKDITAAMKCEKALKDSKK